MAATIEVELGVFVEFLTGEQERRALFGGGFLDPGFAEWVVLQVLENLPQRVRHIRRAAQMIGVVEVERAFILR